MNIPPIIVDNLSIDYLHGATAVRAVDDVSFQLYKGETLGLVGESGCGKTTIALALMNLLPKNESRISTGRILLNNKDITHLPDHFWQEIRGKKLAMIFQDPFSSLNPVMTIEAQIAEALERVEAESVFQRAIELLNQVQLADALRILKSYPHQLSGGQRQRVMIAIALSQNPDVLIADEPTTALDVTVQAEIMSLLKSLQKELKISLLFITHNLGLIKIIAQRVMVMQNGKCVEMGPVENVLHNPQHPYTQELIKSVPRLTKCIQ